MSIKDRWVLFKKRWRLKRHIAYLKRMLYAKRLPPSRVRLQLIRAIWKAEDELKELGL